MTELDLFEGREGLARLYDLVDELILSNNEARVDEMLEQMGEDVSRYKLVTLIGMLTITFVASTSLKNRGVFFDKVSLEIDRLGRQSDKRALIGGLEQ